MGFAGPNCEFSDAANCSSLGVAQYDGSCYCNRGYSTANCSVACEPGFAGSSCQYSDATTCSRGGEVQTDGTCHCDELHSTEDGDEGQCGTECEGNGAVDVERGVCRCAFCFAGTTCGTNACLIAVLVALYVAKDVEGRICA